MRRQLFAAAAAIAMVLGIATTGMAASPASGSVGPSNTSTSWSGQSFTAAATPGPGACQASALCDDFSLDVQASSSYWDTHTGGVTVTINWGGSGNNFDLYVYSGGAQVAASGGSGGTSESAFISNAAGTYDVKVVPISVVNSGYNGSATFASQANPTSGGGSTGGGGGGGGQTGGGGGGSTGGKTSGGGTTGGGSGSSTSGTQGSSYGGTGRPGTCAGCSFGGDPVSAEKVYFIYGVDRKDWYWQKQFIQVIPGTGQPIQLPNPQSASTLPVAVDQGQPDRISALAFGLTDRGLQPGSNIVEFKLTIAEGATPDAGDQPEYNADGKQIMACQITAFWPDGGGADLWEQRPDANKTCVTGKRTGKSPDFFWTFDLTKLAQPWGTDPFGKNNGILFEPVIAKDAGPGDQGWQINLKIPSRDDPTTPPNEYKDTKDRVVAQVAFTTAPTTPTTTTTTTTTTTPTTSGTGGTFTGGGSSSFPTSTTTTTTTTTSPIPSAGTGTGTTGTTTAPVASVPTPKPPGIVWLLIPIGLLALWAIRQVVLEPVGGMRRDGVIAAIRRRNAAAKGIPVAEAEEDVLTQARAATRRARSLIRRSLRRR